MKNTYSGWHVLYVKHQHEKKIHALLEEYEFDSFLPTVTTLRQWSDRKKKLIKPLFPSYVFLNVRSKKEFHKALNINGVFKYLRFGEEYATLRNTEIDRIKRFLNLEGISEVATISHIPGKGDLMTINYGPLNGLDCEVIKTNNRNKVFVRIESLRRNITAIVPNHFLTKRFSVGKKNYSMA
ncbi:MAG: UpxY family transcription antiterminator [Bacteroidota bacterium]